jgi:hypothetical protein
MVVEVGLTGAPVELMVPTAVVLTVVGAAGLVLFW